MTKLTVMTGAFAVALMFAIPQVVSAAPQGCPKGVKQTVKVTKSGNTIRGGNKNTIENNIASVDCKNLKGKIKQNVTVKGNQNTIKGGSKNKIKNNIGSVK